MAVRLTAAEKDMIAYYELCWQLRQKVPTVDEVVAHMRKKRSRISHVAINYYLGRQPVISALTRRGIPFRNHTQNDLTPIQIAAATVANDYINPDSLHQKLDKIGVKSATYQAWLLDPAFKNLVQTIADRNLDNIHPVAISEYTKLIASGEWNAIKYYLDVTGAAKKNEAPQTEQLMKTIIEIIQRHVKDPVLLNLIGKDILDAAQHRESITSYIVEPEEVASAQRQLGIG